VNKRYSKINTKAIRSKKLSPNQRYRQSIGNHTHWQDKRQGSQKDQDSRIQRLSRHPGLHSGNEHRQNFTHAAAQLLGMYGILSVAQISDANPATTQKNIDKRSSPYQNYQQAFSDNLTNYQVQDNHALRVSRQTNLNATHLYNQHASISKPVPEITTQKYMPNASLAPLPFPVSGQGYQEAPSPLHSENINKTNLPMKHKTSLLKKMDVSSSENIINEISNIIHDDHFNARLRFQLDYIFKFSRDALEVKYAPKEDKSLFILMKCIQHMNSYIKNNPSNYSKEILDALFTVAERRDTPHAKDIFSKFKEKFISESGNAEINISNSSIPNAFRKMQSVKDMIFFNSNDKTEIIFKEQTQHLCKLLERHGLIADQAKPLTIVNNLVLYLSREDHKKRITRVVRASLKPLGMCGSGKEEHISAERKMRVIAEYLNHAILGMPLDTWIAKKIQNVSSYHLLWFNNRHLKLLFNNVLNFPSDKGELTQEARQFYRDNVLSKSLPILTLQLSAEDNKELHSIDITQPRWGFIHAGTMIINDSGAGLIGLTLADIEDVGMTLYIMLRQGIAPEEYFAYFRLPALIYYARNVQGADVSMLTDQKMQQAFQRYFAYIKDWEKKHNPLEQLPDLIQGWKTRTALARNIMTEKNISDKCVTDYLNSNGKFAVRLSEAISIPLSKHNVKVDSCKYGLELLPNIDKVFKEQNLKLANIASKVDKLVLPRVFDSLSEEEQHFIEQSKVDRVRIQFNAQDSFKKVPLPPAAQMGLLESDAFVYHIPDNIDLLACTLNREERIYALEISKGMNGYALNRVDRNRQALLDLLEDSRVASRDEDYKIRVTSHLTLKEKMEAPQKFIENLARYHKKKLLIELDNRGYDKTTQEKVGDFLLELIPFYTCITESNNGNTKEAISACMFDIIGIVPFSGKVIQTGARFSLAMGGVTSVALRYGIKQATIINMLRQSGVKLIHHSPFIAKRISPQVIRSLNTEFLGVLDPGFGLIAGTLKGSLAIMKVIFEMLIDEVPWVSKGLRVVYFNFMKKIVENPKIKFKLKKIKDSEFKGNNLFKFVKGLKLMPDEVIAPGLNKIIQQKTFKVGGKGKTTWNKKKEERSQEVTATNSTTLPPLTTNFTRNPLK
jgi:hypothetical protein